MKSAAKVQNKCEIHKYLQTFLRNIFHTYEYMMFCVVNYVPRAVSVEQFSKAAAINSTSTQPEPIIIPLYYFI